MHERKKESSSEEEEEEEDCYCHGCGSLVIVAAGHDYPCSLCDEVYCQGCSGDFVESWHDYCWESGGSGSICLECHRHAELPYPRSSYSDQWDFHQFSRDRKQAYPRITFKGKQWERCLTEDEIQKTRERCFIDDEEECPFIHGLLDSDKECYYINTDEVYPCQRCFRLQERADVDEGHDPNANPCFCSMCNIYPSNIDELRTLPSEAICEWGKVLICEDCVNEMILRE